MRKYSIRTKMFSAFFITTSLSFLLMLLCFNLITTRYIAHESVRALERAADSADRVLRRGPDINEYAMALEPDADSGQESRLIQPEPDEMGGNPEMPISEEEGETGQEGTARPDGVSLALQLYSELLNDGNKEVGFFLADRESGDLLYPVPPMDMKEQDKQNTVLYDRNEIEKLRAYLLNHSVDVPVAVPIEGADYYALEKPFEQSVQIVFYKNNQQLRILVRRINLVLLSLLVLFGAVIAVAVMRLTNGLVHSINKLCRFANEIGNGALRRQKLELRESELSVLEMDMNRMAEKLSAYDTEQKTFFQNVSHELKTPLMSIQGYAEGITSRVFQGEKAMDAAAVILTESDRLSEMIDNLLCLSHLDSKDRFEERTEFDAVEALQKALRQTEAIAGEKRFVLRWSGGSFPVYGNQPAFEKGVINLLTNAVRYAERTVTVSSDAAARTISVADDGPGIAAADLPFIFQRFYKGPGGQSGIGLAIAETAVHAMGGSISVENRQGAVFTISFPPCK